MRILVITKRQYTGRDLLDDRYGRLYEIPGALAAQGHQVQGLTLSYRSKQEGVYRDAQSKTVIWESMNGLPFLPPGAIRHLQRLAQVVEQFAPDVVWASSDAWHAIAAWLVCRPTRIPYVVDLYDNYEHFGLTRFPGIAALLRRACREADGLSLVSRTLDIYIESRYRLGQKPRIVLGNAVDTSRFRPVPQEEARRNLGLPESVLMIGTAGALDASRGISILLDAFMLLSERMPALHLVLVGPRDKATARFNHPRLIDLGVLSPDRIPLIFNALDVAVICNIDSGFGRYCYPQKFQEIIACGTPLLAADIGEMSNLLADRPDCLFSPRSAESLARSLEKHLHAPQPLNQEAIMTWQDRARALSQFFDQTLRCKTTTSVGSIQPKSR